jgi:hypothetical protein
MLTLFAAKVVLGLDQMRARAKIRKKIRGKLHRLLTLRENLTCDAGSMITFGCGDECLILCIFLKVKQPSLPSHNQTNQTLV